MIGNLTIDKASMNISYFLNTIRIISLNGGRISRRDFVNQMAEFIGVSAQKNGKENRTPYNKSKLPRYFGFVDIDTDNDGINYLVLTNRGRKLSEYIGEKEDAEPDKKYYIVSTHREDFIDLIFESVIFDSFGKNNSGAEQSNTDVEPPKVIFKTLLELGKATAEEISYVMFGLNNGKFTAFEAAIAEIQHNRENLKYDYSEIMEEWKVTNIISDFKLINIFTDDNIKLLTSERDDDIGKLFYYLSPTLSDRHLAQIASVNAIYQPLRLFVYTDGNDSTIQQWVEDAVLGRVSDNSFVYRFRSGSETFIGSVQDGTFVPGVFEEALLKAFQNEKRNVFLVIEHTTEKQVNELLGKYRQLLNRINDLSSDKHGWSETTLEDADVYNYIVANCRHVKSKLPENQLLIPSNLQMVGTIIMDNLNGNEQFDYEFTRCLVKTNEDESPQQDFDYVDRVTGGTNILLYGVPGSGKSWTIEHEYCNEDSIVERLVFHPDYTNADFVGQILPVVDEDKQVTYEFTPGPFTTILSNAYRNPMSKYILIIEEINRGNAPAIFGEVFQLLDRKVEMQDGDDGFPVGTSEYGITHKYMAEFIYGKPSHKVRIPSNLSIIGTMNTSDQNVFTLDTAFQRRWQMRLIENNFDNVRPSLADAEILDTDVTWKRFCETVNTIIVGNKAKMASAEDKRLGVYFVHENDLTFDQRALPSEGHATLLVEYNSLLGSERLGTITSEQKSRLTEIREAVMHNRLFPEKVIKYLWDDAFKFNPEALFDTDGMDNLEKVIRTFIYSTGHDRFKIFKQTVRDTLYTAQQ
jgi:hypothetical protein